MRIKQGCYNSGLFRPKEPLALLTRAAIAIALSLNLVSCFTLPHHSITASQLEYHEHLRASKRAELLYNIVALQHNEAPYFLSASSILSQLSKEGSVSTELALGPASDSDLGSLGGSIVLKESPTITYIPLQGENYTRLLLTPLPPPLVLALVESGWPIDLLMQLSVRSLNGIRNNNQDSGDFYELTQQLKLMQKQHDFAIKIQKQQDSFQALFVSNPALNTLGQERMQRLRSTLGLENATSNVFDIRFNEYPADSNELAMVTRSIFEIMTQLGQSIAAPNVTKEQQPIRVISGNSLPATPYVFTRYRNRFYWIEAGDTSSEKAFLLTQLLLELNNSSTVGTSPILSIGAL